jgi:hypothetical protein
MVGSVQTEMTNASEAIVNAQTNVETEEGVSDSTAQLRVNRIDGDGNLV